VPQILDKLEFRSNNEHHRPVIRKPPPRAALMDG
jgi:hypothetical protein